MNRHRIFIAVSVPPDAQKRLVREVAEWQNLPIRWAKEEHIHITLLFIGSVDDEELSRIVSLLPLAVERLTPFDLTLNRINVVPNAGRPRMVWAEGETASELAELAGRVEQAVFGDEEVMRRRDADEGEEIIEGEEAKTSSAASTKASQRKLFRLHVTLGRMIPFAWAKLGSRAPRIEKNINISFSVNSVKLMESELGSGGPTYTILSSIALE